MVTFAIKSTGVSPVAENAVCADNVRRLQCATGGAQARGRLWYAVRACACACMRVCVRVRACVRVLARACVRACVFVHVRARVRVRVCACVLSLMMSYALM